MTRPMLDTPPMNPDELRDMRFGNRRVTKMYAQVNELRQAIASEGSPRVQRALDKVEEHIDFAYQMAAERRAADEALESGSITVREYTSRTQEPF